ncbi:MAG: methyltransferase domain-containing protein [Cyclonatronaceae bacterium]
MHTTRPYPADRHTEPPPSTRKTVTTSGADRKNAANRRFLAERRTGLVEWMDRSDCDPVRLHNTYRYFPVINALISRWDAIYRRLIRPGLRHGIRYRLLDVGSGGGDIARNLHRRARRDGFQLDVTGIDPDPRALKYARSGTDSEPGLRFLQTDTTRVREKGDTYDIVVCNHVLHHLPDENIPGFLDDLAALARHRVICSDIERSAIGYALFSVATWPLFPNSFIRADGLISIRKSFHKEELQSIAPSGWRVFRQFPFRLLALYDHQHATRQDLSAE